MDGTIAELFLKVNGPSDAEKLVARFQNEHEDFGMIGIDFMCDLKWESDYEILFG